MPSPPSLPAPTPRPAGAPLALDGVKVADFSHFIAGPLCARTLADLGAQVIKIEKVDGGDDMRRLQPAVAEGESAAFLWNNRNKRSIALDLKAEEGREIAKTIAARSDIVLENFSTGVMDRLGLGYDVLAALNPRLIYCSISAYGRSGSLKDRLGFDSIAQAESGFMSMNGEPDQIGQRAGPSVMDMSTALATGNAILAALFARERTGRGQFIEAALYDQAVTLVGFHAMNYLVSGVGPTRFGNNSRDTVPTAAIEAADGPIYVTCANDRTWQRMAAVLGRPDLATDPEFATTPARVRNRDRLMDIVGDIIVTQSRDHWLAQMRKAGVPAGSINSVAEAFSSPEIHARELLSAIPHPTVGTVPNVAPAFRLHGTPIADPVAAPVLGQHTAEILQSMLGYDESRIAALAEARIVRLAT
jgi:crotonobetainyl-CoA:carnitine CoA-transferase CaiB-like acyl-CoA transferase